jgi:hypothetical protein
MPRLADVVQRHAGGYVERYGASMLPSHARALQDIQHCRTPEMGGHLAECAQCKREHLVFHSCRNRACPRCGHDATTRWLAKQRELLLRAPYFHVVFTLPAELRRLVRSHQRELLSVLFRAAFESLTALCADPRFLGAKIGALAVMHTWTRTLEWHPHVHMLVPGGGLRPDGRSWVVPPNRPKRFLVPERALAAHFRARFLHHARHALPSVTFPEIPWQKKWIVFAKPVVHGADKVLEYLGRYVHRTAMSDKSILSISERTVSFGYRDSRSGERKSMTVGADDFLRRFLQHVPPKGFHRVRAFGLLHPEHRDKLRQLQLLLGRPIAKETQAPPVKRPLRCCHCDVGALVLVRRIYPSECVELASVAERANTPTGARAPPAPSRQLTVEVQS